jgi:peptide/nickel transport system substrate-binding protein
MGMFVDTPPYNDVRIRKALKLVIDREAMVQTALLDFGFPGNDNPIPPSSPDAYRHDVMPQDLTTAKKLLTEAGYPNGITVDLNVADAFPGTMAMVQAYQQMAADAGIKVNLVVTPPSEYWDSVWLKKPFAVSNWGARPTVSALSVAYRQTSKWNETHWNNPEYERLLDEASKTKDDQERREIYQRAEKMLSEDGGVIVPIFSTEIAVLRKGCVGYTPPADHNRQSFLEVHCQ